MMQTIEKRKKKRNRIVSFLLLVFVFALTFLGFVIKVVFLDEINNDVKQDDKPDNKVLVEEEIIEEDPIKRYSLSLIMGGDSLIHSSVYSDAKKDSKYDFTKMLENIKPIVSKYDLAYYNQETILGGTELGLSSYPTFNSPYEVGDAFIDAGFNVVSLANNHTLDRGSKAIINSRKYWNSKDVMVNGSATSQEEKDNIDIREKNGITYALLSYTTSTNGLTRKNDYYVNWYSDAAVKKDVEKIRDKVDFLMVAMHWGVEYNTGVSANQKKTAKYLAGLGVDLVIGCHPHVIEPVEYIGDTLVIYSLGNFLSGQTTDDRLSGLLMSVEVNKTVDTTTNTITVSVDNPTAEFIYTYSDRSTKTRKGFKIYPYSMLNEKLFKNYKSMYDTLKKRVISLDDSITVVGLTG